MRFVLKDFFFFNIVRIKSQSILEKGHEFALLFYILCSQTFPLPTHCPTVIGHYKEHMSPKLLPSWYELVFYFGNGVQEVFPAVECLAGFVFPRVLGKPSHRGGSVLGEN